MTTPWSPPMSQDPETMACPKCGGTHYPASDLCPYSPEGEAQIAQRKQSRAAHPMTDPKAEALARFREVASLTIEAKVARGNAAREEVGHRMDLLQAACTLLELKDTELAALKAEVERMRKALTGLPNHNDCWDCAVTDDATIGPPCTCGLAAARAAADRKAP